MKLVSSWSHYLDFECNDCGEITHVGAARDFPATATCRSRKCRTSNISKDRGKSRRGGICSVRLRKHFKHQRFALQSTHHRL